MFSRLNLNLNQRAIVAGSQGVIVRRPGANVQAGRLKVVAFPVKIVQRVLFPPAQVRVLKIAARRRERVHVLV